MYLQRVDPVNAIAWLRSGWQCFMVNPVRWILITILFLVIILGLQLIPLLGSLILTLISPALLGGWLHAANEARENRSIQLNYLFFGLTDKRLRMPMLTLGAFWLALSILLTIVVMMIVSSTIGLGALFEYLAGGSGGANNSALGLGVLLAFMIALALILGILSLMIYSVPLVLFDEIPPLEAMKSSAKATIINAIPILIFSTVYIILAIIATIPFGFGFLVLIPVSTGALLASYQDIYPEEPYGTQ
jgi:uncharacterized membrane protein